MNAPCGPSELMPVCTMTPVRAVVQGRTASPFGRYVSSQIPVRARSPHLIQPTGELPGRGGGIVRLGDGADHDHPGGPGRQHIVQPVQADATDREPRPGRILPRYVAQQAQPSRRAARPWFAIGGISLDRLDDVLAAGATRVVVVRAITEADDPAAATRAFARRLYQVR